MLLDRFLIDNLGPMNVMIPLTALAGIMTYAWPFAQTEASLIVVTVFYGFVFFFFVSMRWKFITHSFFLEILLLLL